jgi:hypothetical protein
MLFNVLWVLLAVKRINRDLQEKTFRSVDNVCVSLGQPVAFCSVRRRQKSSHGAAWVKTCFGNTMKNICFT